MGDKPRTGSSGDECSASTKRRYAVWRPSRAKEGMSRHTRRSTLVSSLLLVMGLGLLFLCTEALASGECRHKIKESVVDFSTGITGKATLCINRTGVSGSIEVEHLQPGDAYTVWFFYWDDPSKCEVPGMCGSPLDFLGDATQQPPVLPLVVFGRFDSAVAPADGEEEFEGRVRGLRLSSGSLVQLIIVRHGPADTSDHIHLARQLLTPEDPNAGAPHLGNVVDGLRGVGAAGAFFQIP